MELIQATASPMERSGLGDLKVFRAAEVSRLPTRRSRINTAAQALGALANLFQCCFKGSQLFRARIGKEFPDFGCVFAKNRRD
jgi:hypothetical protein